ncbi:hypothetical protein JL721_7671 [Aureococcus anophagefferens]|nr:hypothetical protein JL721_7671 [Aureococcus anophagefferens]
MPGLGYGGHGQHFVDYGHYEEFEDLGVGPAEYGDVSLSFRGLPMVFVFAAAFVATGYYLLFVFDPRGKKRAYAETAKAQLESAWPAAKEEEEEDGGGGDREAADQRARAAHKGNRKVEDYDEAAYLLNLESGEWFKPEIAGAPPPARAAPALAVYKDEAVVVFGGRTASGFANDVWKLQFPRPEDPDEAATLAWKRVHIDDPKPPGRDGHAAVIAHAVGDAGDVCVVDGDGAGLFNDVYVLRTARDTLNWTRLALDWRSDWTMEKDTARRLAEREARRRAHEAALEDPLRPTTAQLFQRRTQRSLSLTDAKLVAMKLEEKRIPERRRRHTDSAIDLPALDPETTPFVKTSVEFVREERQRHAAWEAEKLGLVTGADERVRALMRSDELRKRAVDGWRPAAAAKFEGELESALKPRRRRRRPRARRHTYDGAAAASARSARRAGASRRPCGASRDRPRPGGPRPSRP